MENNVDEPVHINIICDEECEEPLPAPQPYKPYSRIEEFLETLKHKINSPKKLKKNVSSKVFEHLKPQDRYLGLNQKIIKIGAKQILQIKYYRDLPKVANDIAICYIMLFDAPVPKAHAWEAFMVLIAQPGLVIQKLRLLPSYVDEVDIDCYKLYRINEIFSKIPSAELKLEPCYYELQLLISILIEFLKLVHIPSNIPKNSSVAHIPTSKKPELNKTSDVINMPVDEILSSQDKLILKQAVSQEKKILLGLNSEISRAQWNEKRNLKVQELKELKEEEEREIELKKNTDIEFRTTMDFQQKNQRQINKIYGDLKFKEERNIKKAQKKIEQKRIKKEAQENFESMKWDEQWQKAKETKTKSELHEIFIEKIQTNRKAKVVELETEKKEQEVARTQAINAELKSEYKELIKQKEIALKILELYK